MTEANADPADPRIMTGAAWEALCDTLKRASRLVLGEGGPDAPPHRAPGGCYPPPLPAARRTATPTDIQVNYGHFASGDISQWGTISSINGLELQSKTDGSFELFLGGDVRPGNWWR